MHFMKLLLTLAFVSGALLFGGCADQSLMTDEEYADRRGPAPYSPDPTNHVPRSDPYATQRY
jgi:hypothetical protein